ncbi:DUF928 domain-containing protein [Scytonema sp. UIC 10036]|uniref:DUF928 domain-containing protein n=1 Tax=Scytonema sp. UIC 10036 TaxID=2304196 RepID=UPI0012DA5C90|nr:DUF928 domain-containing protein [Scytonema sp. UIC 10036]MUG91331.1 DUF928 domain-containing protein [Scytonema sp. UIC 10036]
MGKVSKQQFLLLIIASLFVVSTLPIQAATQPQAQGLLRNINIMYLALSWGDVVTPFRRKKRSGGGRGSICTIAPQKMVDPQNLQKEGTLEIWNTRPLFLWNIQGGTANLIELFQRGGDKVIWSQEVPKGETKTIYNGKPLQPGQFYEWRLTASMPYPVKSPTIQFQVMESQKRDRITKELTQLEARLKKQRANAEKIALEKANYFAQQELWSDALSEMYAVPNPSAELKSMLQQIPSSDYCDASDTTVSR